MTATTTENEQPERKPRTLKPDAIRDAIRENGRVEVPLEDPTDAAEKKRTVNKIFGRAYSLGLKGRFGVRIEDGRAIGEVKEQQPEPADA